MKGLEQLLDSAKAGTLAEPEVQAVADELRSDPRGPRAYTLLHIVGRSLATEHRPLVEAFLDAEWDPMLGRLALQILCSFWNETPRYRDRVVAALQGFTWDEDDDVKQMALSIAGKHLASHRDPALLGELLRIFADANEEQTARESAYLALGIACGRRWQDLPVASRHFDLEHGIDESVLVAARSRLNEE